MITFLVAGIMITLSYNLSPTLAGLLKRVDHLRTAILVTPIAPKQEIRQRWEATLSRIFWSLTLSANPLGKADMARLLTPAHSRKRLSDDEKNVLNYQKALRYIEEEWIGSERQVTVATLKKLYEIACKPTLEASGDKTKARLRDLNLFLDYLKTGSEHPVVQAGIAQSQLITIAPFDPGNGRVARLASYVFFYKYGYDAKGLIVLDEYFRRDVVGLKEAIESIYKYKNLTLYLEYFAKGVLTQLNKAYEAVKEEKYQTDIKTSFWRLNQRQKMILEILSEPGATITNKEVQKAFKVSQITASRDLAKLNQLNLAFAHGQGRSTHYTKV